jgi:hypothetical protein
VTQVSEEPSRDSGRRTPPSDASASPASPASPASVEPEAPLPEGEGGSAKKERVLHTRVPAVLERELKRFADNLRVPVSNLVRTILEDALNVADAATENVEERLKKAAHQLEVEREKLKKRVMPDPLSSVFAFQDVTIAQPAQCVKCGRDLKPGDKAHLGLTDGPAYAGTRRIFACDACIPK